MMRFWILLAALLLIAPSVWAAPDDTCTIQGACTLDSITDGTCTGGGSITCVGGTTTPGADDLFVVDTGGRYPRFRFTVTESGASNGGYQLQYRNPITGQTTITPVMPVSDDVATGAFPANYIRRFLKDALGTNFILHDCPAATQCSSNNAYLEWSMTGADACGTTIQASDFSCIPESDTDCGGGDGVTVNAATVIQAGVAPTTDAILTIGGDWTFDGTTTGTGFASYCSDATYTSEIKVVHSDTLHGIDVTLPIGVDYAADGYGVSPAAMSIEGTLTVQGGWYNADTGTAELVSDIADVGGYAVGEIIPCPLESAASADGDISEDCGGLGPYSSGRYVGIRWPEEYEVPANGGNDGPYYKELIDRLRTDVVTNSETVLVTFPDTSYGTALDVANDAWAYYRVVDVDGPTATAPYYVIIDLYPGDLNPFDFAQSRIQGKVGTTLSSGNGAASRGSASIELTQTDLATGTTDTLDYSGRWIRFEDPNTSGRWECKAYPIGRIADHTAASTTGDVLYLAGDPDFNDGFSRDISTSENYFIDYGWKCGEPIAFGNFPRFISATGRSDCSAAPAACPEYDDSHIVSRGGDIDLSGFYSQELWGFTAYSGTVDAAFTVHHDIAANTGEGRVWDLYTVSAPTLGPGFHIAGGPDQDTHQHYGVRLNENGIVTLRDFDIRHTGDDSILTNAFGTSTEIVDNGWEFEKTNLIRLLRGSISWHSESSDSAAILESVTSSTGIEVRKFLSRGSSDYTGVNSLFTLGNHTSCLFEDVTILGSKANPFTTATDLGTSTRDGCRSDEFLLMFVFGDNNGTVNPAAGSLYPPGDAEDFVIRNVWSDDTEVTIFSRFAGNLRNGYFKTVHTETATDVPQQTGARVENVGLFDLRDHAVEATPSADVGAVPFSGNGSSQPERYANTSALFTNITIANYPNADLMTSADVDNTHARSGLYILSSPVDYPQFKNFAIAYWDATDANNPYGGARIIHTDIPSLTFLGAWCFFGNYGSDGSNNQIIKDIGGGGTVNDALAVDAMVASVGQYIRNTVPQFFDPNRGQWWPTAGSPWQVANCGMQRGAGNGQKLHGAKLLDLHQEVQDDVGREQVGSGSVYGPLNRTTYGKAFSD